MKKRSIKEIKRECVEDRKAFKRELYDCLKDNRLSALLLTRFKVHIVQDRHIRKMWKLLNKYPNVNAEYHSKLFGEYIFCRETIWEILMFLGFREIVENYIGTIPEELAMGDAIEVAYAVLRKRV